MKNNNTKGKEVVDEGAASASASASTAAAADGEDSNGESADAIRQRRLERFGAP